MTDVDKDRKTRPILSDREFDLMLTQSRVNDTEFLRLRNPAILCVLRITGKRRGEIAGLERKDVWVEGDLLSLNFKLLKKSRKHTKENGTIVPAAPPPEKTRYVPLKDPLILPILDYMEHLEREYPGSSKFWLHVRPVFGVSIVFPEKGIRGRQVYNVVRDAGDAAGVKVWPHLFRETAGGEEARLAGDSLKGINNVMDRIDVTERTAWRYMNRYVKSIINRSKTQ
ncbi:MAG: hypothetical protein A2Z70_00775 [Chloroflexi bacterium RBG_13_48_17]|nr:MAG: hypothetical protein A2Z70_00775 [Chloroflexi bacterium RBG_13_48_17]